MSILVYAEHDNSELKADTLKTVAAAQQIGGDITLLVAGYQCQGVAEQAAKINGVSKVIVADNNVYQHQLAENIGLLVTELAGDYDVVMATALTTGKNFMPRVAALLDVAQISDIVAIESADTFVRPIYAGNAIATVKSLDAKKVITVRSTGFDAVETDGCAEIISLAQVFDAGISSHVSDEITVSERPDLGAARVVISGGRGMQNGDNFKLLYGIADKLGAAIGASRAAVDAGFVPNDMQVGQTGKIVAPDLYIAVGISGAIQHLAGMKDSKVIVAINKDPEAPIFQVADYGIVADLFEALPELEKAL
ncbi:electron transfer flavoprotein subunit alpha/FixB family protein [Colwellia hornerae]|uniref:Electron transfer flavoprotein subunit alpha n=1 Tax=Colwellia hornerae TaxID=89402 RepID=A0A5C6QME8_9GAMM|nr:FAD-binding protein [Colwellia hornerae]TWX53718.1 electron transfer flavoprotein subunit alpha/FixB family protein [Colwellia hornerae]TWX60368.1 electron transfer flavoprotein subunit alpha/FixB family protein [Colwellia hornerae]TWX70124.1 electron transfer flavoprotein subunit alpha/FixB family protein [Colwellia hornerae]